MNFIAEKKAKSHNRLLNKIKENMIDNVYLLFGISFLITIVFIALIAPYLGFTNYSKIDLYSMNLKPSSINFLGTDNLGRDVFTRLIYATRISLLVGISTTFIQISLGTTLGLMAGYLGGLVDFIISRIIDIIMCFPFFIVAISIAAITGPSLKNIIIIISILSWTDVARVVRAETLSLKKRDFVTVSKSIGFSNLKIIVMHILPNVLPSIVVASVIAMANAILMESSLSFLGLGVKDPMPSLGNMLTSAQNMRALQNYYWQWLPPGIIIFLTILSINFIGEGLKSYFGVVTKENKINIGNKIYVNIEIKKGEIIGLIGESGSGKSLTALSAIGLCDERLKVHGSITFEGENLLDISKERMRAIRGNKISIVFQEPMSSLNPLVKVGDQIAEVFKIHTDYSKEEIRKKVLELIQDVNLENPEQIYDKYPHELSGGMCQRICIAMAIALKPRLLIADEPTTSIDYSLKIGILELIKELSNKYNMSVLFITHDINLMRKFADRIMVMYLGEIVESSSEKEFFKAPRHPYSVDLLRALPNKKASDGRFYQIAGKMPSINEKSSACSFNNRCRYKQEICETKKPENKIIDGTEYKCHFIRR